MGSHTVDHLLSEGYSVKCLIRPGQTNIKWLQNNTPVDIVEADLFNASSILKVLDNVDYIIHIAGITKAKHKKDFFAGNVRTTQQLLIASSEVGHIKKLCFISSLTAVGPSKNGIPLDESAPCRPITTYGESKLEAELLCKEFMNRIPIVILRPPAVFGPRDTDILEMFKLVSLGFRPSIGSPEKTLSLVYAPDLAKGIIHATMDERTSGEIYNISDPTIFKFSSLIDHLATFVKKRTVHIHIPNGLVYSIAAVAQLFSLLIDKPAVLNIEKARDLLQKHWICTPQKIQNNIGFHTTTSIYDGIRNTYHWYKQEKWL